MLDAQKAAAEGPVVTIENGDWLQGSPLAYYVAKISKQPDQLTRLYNEVGYDAGIIGNHEFNYGSDYLRQALKTLTYQPSTLISPKMANQHLGRLIN